MAPDLRASPIPLDSAGFAAVVRDGALVAGGMPGTPGITDAQLESLQHYIRQRARDTL
jgi:quinohemoprotein ethanol dehydrogenase